MRTALFDSGSTNLHFALWDGEIISGPEVFPYPENEAGLADLISTLFAGTKPDNAAASSVSYRWREPLFSVIDRVIPGKLSIARYASDLGVEVEYDNPLTYGIDRALASYGAYRIFRDSCVVIDAGTAVTFDIIDINGRITGGYIFPGFKTLAKSLCDSTGLPEAGFSNDEGPGHSTLSVLGNGVSAGFSAAVNALTKSAASYANTSERIVITGGGSGMLRECLDMPYQEKTDLVLESLGLLSGSLPKYP